MATTQQSVTATPGKIYLYAAKGAAQFGFTAKIKTFNFNAKNKAFNFNAKAGPQ